MKAMKRGKKSRVFLICGVFLILAAALICFLLGSGQLKKWRDLARLSQESYSGAFLAMYDISNYSEEDFGTYRGVPSVKAEYAFQTWWELSKYLTIILSSENTVTNVYLGLDPVRLWERSDGGEKWTDDLGRYLTPYLEARPDVTYEILLPAPSLWYWLDLEPEQVYEDLAAYERLVKDLGSYPNVLMYFMGGEHWLIANPGNYQKKYQTTVQVSQKMFLHTFCDHDYLIWPDNASEMLGGLLLQIEQERQEPAVYPDLSQWCMICFGDSVLEYNAGSFSVPGVIEGLSGAQVYNCAVGGTPATDVSEASGSFQKMISRFLEQDADASGLSPDSNYLRALTQYRQDNHEGKNYCFVINFGLNDYFGGHPVENLADSYDVGTYAGSLRTGVRALQEAYPEAEIFLLTPTYTTYFSEGMEINSEVGGVLSDYVEAAACVADDMGIHLINSYADSGINAGNQGMYLADGCHPNETGAFFLGTYILESIGSMIAQNQ